MNTDAQLGVAQANRARAELYDTLGQLRDRLDYAQRIDDSLDRAKHRIAEEKRDNPVVFAAAVAGVAAACGLAVWGIARKVMSVFE
ncbi:MAG: DUF3618 domain-containing protein [Leucobacter sp.]|jgi:hypothetical protein|nr:DUF3618 domain-containing protein [Leucobacter sp.]